MTDLSLEEQRLLPFVTVSLLRERAVLRQEKLLVRPFPDCHECGQPVVEIVAQEAHFPTVKRWFALRPCGHRFEVLEERLAQVREAANRAADEIENRAPGGTPDWLRGGVCCVCHGQGGPAVYRNYRDQAFCSHCCECVCRTIPCSKIPAADHVCKPDAGFVFCPASGEVESDCHGGFDTCCDRPQDHLPVGIEPPTLAALQQAARAAGKRLTIELQEGLK